MRSSGVLLGVAGAVVGITCGGSSETMSASSSSSAGTTTSTGSTGGSTSNGAGPSSAISTTTSSSAASSTTSTSSATSASSSSSGAGGGAACSSNLLTDAKNCGRCGHSCLDEACVGGLCQPTVVGDGAKGTALATDGTYVYWTDNSTALMRAPVDGSAAPTSIATLSTGYPLFDSTRLAGGYLAYEDEDAKAVYSVQLSSGSLVKLFDQAAYSRWITKLVVDGTNVIFVAETFYSVPVAGGPVVAVTPGGTLQAEFAVIADDTYFYGLTTDYSTNGPFVSRTPKAGGGSIDTYDIAAPLPTNLARSAAPVFLAVNGYPGGAPACGTQSRLLDYSPMVVPTIVGTVANEIQLFAVDASTAYLADACTDDLVEMSRADGSTIVVASNLAGPLTIDASYIYYFGDEPSSALYRVAK